MKRTHNNGSLRVEQVGTEVTLVGWVSRRRNLGSLVFINLRDRSGLVQLLFDEEIAEKVKDVRNEYILQVTGLVQKRNDANPKLATGEVEVKVTAVTIINDAETTPIIIADETDALEDTRLKYRYLDLRREPIQNNLILRHKVALLTRNYLSEKGFIEVETPILCKSTPEGARDYLVPSRISKGEFYALPQSPQIYKQLLMVGGMEKYFQIARCFRDEDLRADRQPEFTQIDIEMSFVEEEDVWNVVEGLMKEIFFQLKGKVLPDFTRITFDECMSKYGSDKPDLRFDLFLTDVSSVFEKTEFGIFQQVLSEKGAIEALVVPNGADAFSRKQLDQLQDFVKVYGAKALAYLKLSANEWSGSIAKTINDNEKMMLKDMLNLNDGDIVFMIADKPRKAQVALGALRNRIAKDLNLITEDEVAFLWVTDFPMFEFIEEENRFVAAHHPFTAPCTEDIEKLQSDPGNCYSRAYDLVVNGYELLSGSIRIHEKKMQEQVFKAIGMSIEEAHEKFGFFVDAFKYGTPPHGGVGIGLERLIMILVGTENIRDVVAFPKTASASDLMSEAPNRVDGKQLLELGIEVIKK